MENNKTTLNNTQDTQDTKITLYLDADDTILLSSVAVIDILNERYNIIPKKTIDDLKDWEYKSIYGRLSKEEKNAIYGSDEFFDRVKIHPDFLDFYNKNYKDFNFVIVTKGTEENIKKKKKFLRKVLDKGFEYIGLPINDRFDDEEDNTKKFDKSCVNMKHGIQIDDRTDALATTNAPIKILYKHNTDMRWNRGYENIENFYATNPWKEIIDILLYVKQDHSMFRR